MKTKKEHWKDQRSRMQERSENDYLRKKKGPRKVKYKHKSHWLEQDDDYELPIINDDEE